MTMSAKRVLLVGLCALWSVVNATDNEMKEEREMAKPWYSRDTEIFGFKIPVSPISLFTVFIVVINVVQVFSDSAYAEASHILLMENNDATKKKLLEMKKEIGNDAAKFAKLAKDFSKCPSSRNGGSLGRFKRGVMAPPFDQAVFSPSNQLNTTIGPVETTFGVHLIYIHQRKI